MIMGQSELSCGMGYKKKMCYHQEAEPTYKVLHTPAKFTTLIFTLLLYLSLLKYTATVI
jgi:hypothetical protein